MVWETRKVRKEVSDIRLPTNIKNASGHAPATYTPYKHATPPPPSNQHQRLRPQAHALTNPLPWGELSNGRSIDQTQGRAALNQPHVQPQRNPLPPSHTTASWGWISMACRPRPCILHLPRMQQRAGEMISCHFHPVFPSFPNP
jgi:hypothetical protein